MNLAIGARLDADAPNYLLSMEHAIMKEKTDTMIRVISGMKDSDQVLYWQFYWSSLYELSESKKECESISNKYNAKYPEEMKIMRIAFEYFHGRTLFISFPHISGKTLHNEYSK